MVPALAALAPRHPTTPTPPTTVAPPPPPLTLSLMTRAACLMVLVQTCLMVLAEDLVTATAMSRGMQRRPVRKAAPAAKKAAPPAKKRAPVPAAKKPAPKAPMRLIQLVN